jgi:RNA polymerase sigma-70 factor, ECF subfamily
VYHVTHTCPMVTSAMPAVLTGGLQIDSLYRAHAARVERWAARLAGPSLDVEDIVQEVFLIAHQQLPKFRQESSPGTWLFGITERVVWHRRRKGRWLQWLGGLPEEVAAGRPSTGPSPAELLESKRATELFYKALEGVSDRYRSVLVLFELEGASGEEIARLKGVRVDRVWVWLHRARAQLRKKVDELKGAADER